MVSVFWPLASERCWRRYIVPIYVDEMNSDVTVMDGDLPLNEAQIERLVRLVLKRLEETQRAARQHEAATTLRRDSAPPLPISE
jgi:hypothetical protein